MTAATAADAEDRAFLGHPKAMGYLAFTEAWERFSFYGMQTLLVLYMTKALLLPGHVEHIVAFEPFSRFLQTVWGVDPTPRQLASATYGLYGLLVYLTPLGGGLLADLIGRTRTIITGALLMALGHFLMAFDAAFLAALLCLVVGCGLFKGNIASQVGSLYKDGDLRRADAFQIFYLAINAGVFAAPIVTGGLADWVDWSAGFAAAGVGMLVSIVIYLWGRRHLPRETGLLKSGKADRPAWEPGDVRTTVILVLLLPVLTASVLCNQQIFNAYLTWADESVAFSLFGMTLPATWLVSVDTVASVTFLAGMVVFWRLWAKRFKEPDELGKLTIGALISITGPLALAAGAALSAATGDKVNILWCVAFHVLNSIAFANMLPVSLALYARAAPRALASTIIGIYYLHLAGANAVVGKIGALLDTMTPTSFWLTHAGIAAASALVFLIVGRFFAKWLSHEHTGGRVVGP